MNNFSHALTSQPDEPARLRGGTSDTTYLSSGTFLIDPVATSVGPNGGMTNFDQIEQLPNGGLRIGAGVHNTTVAHQEDVKKRFPVLAQAILSGARLQLRNVATTAWNLLQRTRCYYFRDGVSPCNKRCPGSGCAALIGLNRIHAVLGTSERCIATHPSDMDVALVALDAVVQLRSPNGDRAVPVSDFYVAYGDDPARENILEPGELVTAVDLPPTPWFSRSCYFKARERATHEFALSSAAVALDLQNGVVQDCRIALGGVATKPWRAHAAEAALKGNPPAADKFTAAIDAELKTAVPRSHNAFKIDLCRRTVAQTLEMATALA